VKFTHLAPISFHCNNVYQKTRANTSFPVIGHGQELCETVLPTYEDVLKYYLLLQNKIESERGGKHPSISEIAETVATRVEGI